MIHSCNDDGAQGQENVKSIRLKYQTIPKLFLRICRRKVINDSSDNKIYLTSTIHYCFGIACDVCASMSIEIENNFNAIL